MAHAELMTNTSLLDDPANLANSAIQAGQLRPVWYELAKLPHNTITFLCADNLTMSPFTSPPIAHQQEVGPDQKTLSAASVRLRLLHRSDSPVAFLDRQGYQHQWDAFKQWYSATNLASLKEPSTRGRLIPIRRNLAMRIELEVPLLKTVTSPARVLNSSLRRPMHPTERIVKKIYELDVDSKIDRAIDFVFDWFDKKISRRDYTSCNYALRTISPESISTDLAVSILSITLSAKDDLVERAHFFSTFKQRLEKKCGPTETTRILQGLE